MDAKKMLEAYAAENGVTLSFDENGACTLPLADDRVLHLQFRENDEELDFLALLGTVPEEARAVVFEKLLAANYYWKETVGATLSWQAELELVVLTYPIRPASVDEATLRGTLDRFVALQEEWAGRLQGMIEKADILEKAADADMEMSDLVEALCEAEKVEDEVRIDA